MSAEKKSSNESSDAARRMGEKTESKRGSRNQQWTGEVKDKMPFSQGHRSSNSQSSCAVVNPYGKPPADPRHKGLEQHAEQLQRSVSSQKHKRVSKTKKDDELVKYMSNLPGFLQQAEKQKNIQVEALNFGVLDWKKLEKWKQGEQMPARDQPKASQRGGSLSMDSGKSTTVKTSTGGKHSSIDFQFKSSSEVRLSEDAQELQRKAKPIQDSQTVSQSKFAGHQKDISQSVKSSSRNGPHVIHDKGKKKEPDRIDSTSGMSSIQFGKQLGKNRTTQDSDMDDSPKHCNAEPQNIILLKPKCHSKRSSSYVSRLSASSGGQLARDGRDRYSAFSSLQDPESRELSHEVPLSCPLPPSVVAPEEVLEVCKFPYQSEKSISPLSSETKSKAKTIDVDRAASTDSSKRINIDSTQKTESRALSRRVRAYGHSNSYSDCFSSQEMHSRELHSGILHSCPLSASAALSQGRGSDHCIYPFPNDTSAEPRLSNAICPESKSCNLDDSVYTESFSELDFAFARQTSRKGRHPSPSRRFSFSLGRLSRSFSFKESSSFSEFSSTQPDTVPVPEKCNISADIDDSKRDKANASGRRRPSPFRRFLDPLLKPRLAHSTEAVPTKGPQSTENLSSVTLHPNNIEEPLYSGTNPPFSVQAVMQVTVKNAIPFFKFLVDNRSDILAAALKQLPSAGKAGCNLTYSFFSVHEIKKKTGGWITNGSKEKNCGFGYKVVAEMKLSRSFLSELNTEQNSVVTESVLYDVNITEGDKGLPDGSPDREIAAVILKDPIVKYNNPESKAGNTCDQAEKESCKSTTVILPGAPHSLPSSGAPSSLIHRWKSGGLCDCGGWDVGCKLKILEDRDEGINFTTPAMSRSSPECLNLFIQGADLKNQPIFSLAPVEKGLYSVKFPSSVPLLEGFSICVAFVTSRVFGDIFDTESPAESKSSVEVNSGNDDEKKNEIKFLGELPARFFSYPPLSPVGRI